MHFKHPEILYALFALLIPILIHLFQLQRFVKVPFTNVKFLKEIELQTRKSSKLKKYLILLSRLLAFAMLIIAFAQPYFSKNDLNKDWETLIFLDNSLSMQSQGEQGELLIRAKHQILENLPSKGNFSLLTLDDFTTDLDKTGLKEKLLQTDYSGNSIDYNSLILKAKTHFNRFPDAQHKLIWISDFQSNKPNESNLNFLGIPTDFISLKPKNDFNLAIDSVWVSENNLDYKLLKISFSNQGKKVENAIVSAFQNQILLAKTNISIPENQTLSTELRLVGDLKKVRIKVDYEDKFPFDNQYFISFQAPKKVNVVVIDEKENFLNAIITSDEFNKTQKSIRQLSNEDFEKNSLIILNDTKEIPANLNNSLSDFVKNGGSLCLIPSNDADVNAINSLFNELKIGNIKPKNTDTIAVNKIHFEHELFQNVFERQVSNFQFPSAYNHFDSNLLSNVPLLSFANQQPFITQIKVGKGKMYWVAAPLTTAHCNFINSPLVVPVFYNMAKMSVLQNQLAYRVGQKNEIPVEVALSKDEVLQLVSDSENVIPNQQIFSDFVSLTTDNQPNKAGFFEVKLKEKPIETLAFNPSKAESNFEVLNIDQLSDNNKNSSVYDNIKDAFSDINDQQNVWTYFKWFIALALLFVLIEIALIKYF